MTWDVPYTTAGSSTFFILFLRMGYVAKLHLFSEIQIILPRYKNLTWK